MSETLSSGAQLLGTFVQQGTFWLLVCDLWFSVQMSPFCWISTRMIMSQKCGHGPATHETVGAKGWTEQREAEALLTYDWTTQQAELWTRVSM